MGWEYDSERALEVLKIRNLGQVALTTLAGLTCASSALADQEASNFAHVVAGPYGRCYVKSVPTQVYDPEDGPRQQGRTEVYRVGDSEDVLLYRFDWFSQRLFVRCGPGDDTVVVRVGPWHRGHNPRADHLSIACYKGGRLLKRYSTLDIAGGEKAEIGGLSKYQNVSASVSHYTVFVSGPEMVRITTTDGPVFEENWVIKAKTVDGRSLTFAIETGGVR